MENYWSEEKKFIGQVRCPKFQFIAQFIFTFSQTRENFRLSLAELLSARRNARCFKELNIKFREGSFPALISTNSALLHSCMCCCDVVLWWWHVTAVSGSNVAPHLLFCNQTPASWWKPFSVFCQVPGITILLHLYMLAPLNIVFHFFHIIKVLTETSDYYWRYLQVRPCCPGSLFSLITSDTLGEKLNVVSDANIRNSHFKEIFQWPSLNFHVSMI